MLLLATLQKNNEIPFHFKAAGVRVYSFEEAVYHVYHNWKQSMDDLLSEAMLAWVGELGLTMLSARLQGLAQKESIGLSERILGFLSLIEYFDAGELDLLKEDLQKWERRYEWEKLKERADYFITGGEVAKARGLYTQALTYDENAELYNNLAIAEMQLGLYDEAVAHFLKAIELSPDNVKLLLHYAEAAILGGKFADAESALAKAEKRAENPAIIHYLQGLIAFEKNDNIKALVQFGEAIKHDPTTAHYTHKLADVYIRMRQYEKALESLARIKQKKSGCYVKEAEIHAASGNTPAAIRAIKTALGGAALGGGLSQGLTADLWVRLAMYHRLNLDMKEAETAITRALELNPDSERARMENARIKKGLGKTREYQAVMNDVLRSFRKGYRE